ncbi:plasma membrane calcium-transporting atpase 2 [Teratosphaeria destructans]|uniref:Plasma membrane calcium-transporting atpase 2 n=1 Tax=Teratosphaeria destructans TaxID=418781 RepID=A0A9W7W6L7_9PEZI|nr:plasma membrane calcium-transporting atpase 2 [Teratosphaeria destructans]
MAEKLSAGLSERLATLEAASRPLKTNALRDMHALWLDVLAEESAHKLEDIFSEEFLERVNKRITEQLDGKRYVTRHFRPLALSKWRCRPHHVLAYFGLDSALSKTTWTHLRNMAPAMSFDVAVTRVNAARLARVNGRGRPGLRNADHYVPDDFQQVISDNDDAVSVLKKVVTPRRLPSSSARGSSVRMSNVRGSSVRGSSVSRSSVECGRRGSLPQIPEEMSAFLIPDAESSEVEHHEEPPRKRARPSSLEPGAAAQQSLQAPSALLEDELDRSITHPIAANVHAMSPLSLEASVELSTLIQTSVVDEEGSADAGKTNTNIVTPRKLSLSANKAMNIDGQEFADSSKPDTNLPPQQDHDARHGDEPAADAVAHIGNDWVANECLETTATDDGWVHVDDDGDADEGREVSATASSYVVPRDFGTVQTVQRLVSRLLDNEFLNDELVGGVLRILNPEPTRIYVSIAGSFPGQHLIREHRFQLGIYVCNINDNHWTTAAADFSTGLVTVFDSLHKRDIIQKTYRDCLAQLQSRSLLPRPGKKGEVIEWRHQAGKHALRQSDALNCGIYSIVHGLCAMHRMALPASIDPTLWRRLLACGFHSSWQAVLDRVACADQDDSCKLPDGLHSSRTAADLYRGTLALSRFLETYVEQNDRKSKADATRADEIQLVLSLLRPAREVFEGKIDSIEDTLLRLQDQLTDPTTHSRKAIEQLVTSLTRRDKLEAELAWQWVDHVKSAAKHLLDGQTQHKEEEAADQVKLADLLRATAGKFMFHANLLHTPTA